MNLVKDFYNGKDIFPEYQNLTTEKDKALVMMELTKAFANQLDKGDTSNVGAVGKLLTPIIQETISNFDHWIFGLIGEYIGIDRFISFNIDNYPDWKIICEISYNKFSDADNIFNNDKVKEQRIKNKKWKEQFDFANTVEV